MRVVGGADPYKDILTVFRDGRILYLSCLLFSFRQHINLLSPPVGVGAPDDPNLLCGNFMIADFSDRSFLFFAVAPDSIIHQTTQNPPGKTRAGCYAGGEVKSALPLKGGLPHNLRF